MHKQRALVGDVVKRLLGPLRDELDVKQNEFHWLQNQGNKHIEFTEEVSNKLTHVENVWKQLNETWEEELRRMQQLPSDLDGLDTSLKELTLWLNQVEATLNAPLTIATCDKKSVDTKLTQHRELEDSVELKGPVVSSLLNLCNNIASNNTMLQVIHLTISILNSNSRALGPLKKKMSK